MSAELTSLDQVLALADAERAGPLGQLACAAADRRESGEDLAAGEIDGLVSALVGAVQSDGGTPAERVALGEALGRLGDPRLRLPSDDDYWVSLTDETHTFAIGKHQVTTAEFRRFVDDGGYDDAALWGDDGADWLEAVGDNTWAGLAKSGALTPDQLVANQPVVGVCWYEARAYAAWAGGRLPNFQERMFAVRGPEKRPYPWGQPFGQGNANTREEVLGRPCAVGLFKNDRTPDGIADLAGNVAEWVADDIDGDRLIAPGAWTQGSMSAWAKARDIRPAETRGADLGFRLARG